ncbi:protein of unknown function [Burkholderia multivorans]
MRVEPNPADARHGIFVTSVKSHGGRNESYWVEFEGIPSDRVWRTPMASIPRPSIDGILPARITSPGDYKYAYPTSEISAADSQATASAPYSTGFALVRHTMAFPKGTTLTFYSLYMHLMSCEDYANFRKRRKPAYWPVRWQVTEFAQDRPSVGKSGQVADAGQRGLRVRKSHPKGEIIGIVPGGAHVSIGKQQNGWGQVKDLHGASLYPAVAGGFVPPSAAIGGWIYMRDENGGPVVKAVMPDSAFDRVVVTASAVCRPDDPEGAGIPVKAGDLIGHLGRYDSLNQCTSGTRMAHIEVFCDDSIESFV